MSIRSCDKILIQVHVTTRARMSKLLIPWQILMNVRLTQHLSCQISPPTQAILLLKTAIPSDLGSSITTEVLKLNGEKWQTQIHNTQEHIVWHGIKIVKKVKWNEEEAKGNSGWLSRQTFVKLRIMWENIYFSSLAGKIKRHMWQVCRATQGVHVLDS